MTFEADLVAYALDLRFDDIPADARQRIVDVTLDTIGLTIGAAARHHESGLICEDYMLERRRGADGGVTLWTGRGRLPADEAALCNGTWAEILDYQDVVIHPRNNGHAGVTLVPAILAVAEQTGANGRAIITALAAGYEVTIAILKALGRRHRSNGRGFRTTSVAAPLGAAVACARLLGLDHERTLNALGIAGGCAISGLLASLSPAQGIFGMDKDLANGLGAQLAVNAAELAARGMTGSHAVVTGDRGVLASHAHGDAQTPQIPGPGAPNIRLVAMKNFAACYGAHAAVEATINLMTRHGVAAGDIRHINVRVKADSAVSLSARRLVNHMAARFSLPYCVASAAVRGRCVLADFEPEALGEASVLAVMDRIELVADPDLTVFHDDTGGFPAIVEITTQQGAFSERIDFPLGSEQRPMSRADLDRKFRDLVSPLIAPAQIDAVQAQARNFAELANIQELFGVLYPTSASERG